MSTAVGVIGWIVTAALIVTALAAFGWMVVVTVQDIRHGR